jgi:hypothetical protein
MSDTEPPALAALKDFDVKNATTALWTFKKSMTAGRVLVITGRWMQTTGALAEQLKSAITSEIGRITEVQEYGLLTETNESSALTISTIETNAGLIVQQAAADVSTKRASKLKDIQNSSFYATKLVSGDTVLYAVKKTDFSWRTSKSITAFWRDATLDVSIYPSFDISPTIDFFILNEAVIISQKRHFESILNYKAAHKDDFVKLQAEPEFQAVFSSLASLTSYVGENKMQLRRYTEGMTVEELAASLEYNAMAAKSDTARAVMQEAAKRLRNGLAAAPAELPNRSLVLAGEANAV